MPTSTSEAPGNATGEKRCVKGLWKAHVTAQRVLAAIVRLQASVQLRHKVLEVIKEYAPGTRDVKQVRVWHKIKACCCYTVCFQHTTYMWLSACKSRSIITPLLCGCCMWLSRSCSQICGENKKYAHDWYTKACFNNTIICRWLMESRAIIHADIPAMDVYCCRLHCCNHLDSYATCRRCYEVCN